MDQKIDAYRSLLQTPFEFFAALLTFANGFTTPSITSVQVAKPTFYQNFQQ
jgi:hypothetical protein